MRGRTRMLEYAGGKVAMAKLAGPRVVIVWDGGVAEREFDTLEDAQSVLDDLPAALSLAQLKKQKFQVTERSA